MSGMTSIKEIYKIGRGPSSSHTIGPERACKIFKEQNSTADSFRAILFGSLAKTGKGHGTDKGLLAGVLGLGVDDVRIRNIFESDIAKSIEYEFQYFEDFNRHPNAVDFIFEGERNLKISGNSVGAGEIEITKINDFSVNLTGKYNTLLLVYKDVPNMISRVTNSIHVNIASFHCDRSAKGQDASMCITVDGEINQKVIDFLSLIEDVYMISYIKKLES